ncbi:MAG: FtsX-like permease family protein [Crocinitomicaceae bacterium]|nr:ABC transporter permease [Crocinitomicaceae bacterium]
MKAENKESRLSKPIVIISLASIILGVSIMIISVSVVTGFQKGIRDKVIGFGSHIQVTNLFDNSSMESTPILIDQEFYPSLEETEDEVRHIQIYAYKPAILQSKRDSVAFELEEKDTVRPTQDILGVLFKGIDQDYDWDFFKEKLIDGKLIDFDSINNQVMISKYTSNIMGYKVGDEIDAYFIMDNGPKRRKFEVCGIYDTGFEEFDKQFIFCQIHHIQKLNNWGVQTYLTVRKDTCINNKFVLQAITTGGSGAYRYRWNGASEYSETDYILLNGQLEENIEVISTDFDREVYGLTLEANSVPDTASAHVYIRQPCACTEELLASQPVEFVSASEIKMPFGIIEIQNGKGTHHLYTGGFEILLNDWDDLDKMDEIIDMNIPGLLQTKKITEMHPDIFAWLDFLDVNIIIIIVLILIVSLINMITSLLVMILEKTNMIGILKAIGATNTQIRRIFLMNSLFLLSRGLFWGNLVGIGLILLQHYTGILSLNPEVYYLDTVPVNINFWHILLINLLTIIVCRITLIFPSFLIMRINPIKAIKFD